MGKFGWKSGSVQAQNLRSGTADVTVDGNGDGTLAIVFKNAMKNSPAVVLTAQEADTTGTLAVSGKSVSGFTARIDGSSVTSDTLTIGYIAFDDTRP